MNITTGLSREKIEKVMLDAIYGKDSAYQFLITINDKKYNAILYGCIVNSDINIRSNKIIVKDIDFEEFEKMQIQVGNKYKIDNDNYYISNIKADGFNRKIEIKFIALNTMLSTY